MWSSFLRKNSSVEGNAGLHRLYTVSDLVSSISGKFQIQGTVVSMLKAILNPMVFVF